MPSFFARILGSRVGKSCCLSLLLQRRPKNIEDDYVNEDDVRTVLARHEHELMAIPGVHGVAVGSAAAHGLGDGACIVVYASNDRVGDDIPAMLDGASVCVVNAGPFAFE